MDGDRVDPRPADGLVGSDDSPWAGNVPIPPAPILPQSWAEPPPPPLDPPVSSEQASLSGGSVTAAPRVPGRPRRWPIAVGVGAGLVALVVVATQVAGGQSKSSNTDVSTPPATVSETTKSPAATTAPPPPPAQWTVGLIDLAPRLAAMTVHTEVVVRRLNGNDEMVTVIDIPSGMVYSIPDHEPVNSARMAVGDSAIVISPSDTTRLIHTYHIGLAPVSAHLPPEEYNVRPRFGTDTFVVMRTQWSDSRPPTYVLSADGSTAQVKEGPLATIDPWNTQFFPTTGEVMVNDAGGTYAVDDAGHARRVSAGNLVAAGANHFLVRVCDEWRECGYEVVDARTGAILAAQPDADPPLDPGGQGSWLSPDGSKLVHLEFSTSSPSHQLITDLRTGASLDIDEDSLLQLGDSSQFVNPTWAADSSGLFVVQYGQLVFIDATTGESTLVTAKNALGVVFDVATRPTTP